MVNQTPQRRRRIMRWALAVSLGVNLLFVGAFAGAAYRFAGGPGAPGGHGPGMRSYATPYVQALPRDKRRAMFQALRSGNEGAVPLSKKARHAQYQQMVSALRVKPFDSATVEAILSTQRDAVLGMQSAAQAAWITEVTEMTPDERANYADALERVLKRGPGRSERRKKRDN